MSLMTSSDHVEVIKSNKGHYKIIHMGFMYTKHKSFNNVTRWRCAARGSCRGSIMTSNDFTRPTPKMAHTHPANYKACELAKARYLIPKVNNFVFKKELFQTNALKRWKVGFYEWGENHLELKAFEMPVNSWIPTERMRLKCAKTGHN